MSIAASTRSPLQTIRAAASVFVALAGVACGLTLLNLGARVVMDIGGACASGGPYVPRVTCPKGVPLAMVGGFWGGLIFVGLYVRSTSKHNVPTLVGLAWPALFLSLGWDFLDYGIDPPGGGGLVWGWLICAVLFALMGGVPLLMMVKPIMSQFGRRPGPDFLQAKVVIPTKRRVRELRSVATEGSGGSPSAPRPPRGSGDGEPLVEALERLGALHASGALDDDEFEAAKQRVLRGEA